MSATYKGREVRSGLKKKGFVESNKAHKFLLYHSLDGLRTEVSTFMSHGSDKENLGEDLISKMAKQCRLDKGDFERLISCPLSQPAYEEKLVECGVNLQPPSAG